MIENVLHCTDSTRSIFTDLFIFSLESNNKIVTENEMR